jgi:hypothetical protein
MNGDDMVEMGLLMYGSLSVNRWAWVYLLLWHERRHLFNQLCSTIKKTIFSFKKKTINMFPNCVSFQLFNNQTYRMASNYLEHNVLCFVTLEGDGV